MRRTIPITAMTAVLKPARGTAANIGKADYPAGDARSDYRAHDNAYRLTNLHHAGVNKADDHNGCGRGRLYNGRNSRAEQYALQRRARKAEQNKLELVACNLLQTVAHERHAEQKQCNAA